MTDYLIDRADEMRQQAQDRIDIIDILLGHVAQAQLKAKEAMRAARLVAVLISTRNELNEQRDAALQVIHDIEKIKKSTLDLPSGEAK